MMGALDVTRLYAQMSTASLLELKADFEGDQRRAFDPETRAFCAGRLLLIAAELRARAELDRGPTL